MILLQILVFVLIYQGFIRPLIAAYSFTRPPRMRVNFCAPADWGVRYEDVQLASSDGVSLNGWYVPSRNGAAVILIHGIGGNRLAVSYHAETLVREGYGVLMLDLRAHGTSGGDRFPHDEQLIDDVLAAVAFLTRQPGGQGLIGVMGVSTGGMMAIQAAARTVAIRAVAADGPMLGSLDDLPPPTGLPDRYWRYPLERFYQAAIRRFSAGSRPIPSNLSALRRLRGRPVLLISTGAGFERRLVHHLYANAGEPRVLWELPGAYHATGWVIEPEAYAQTMVDFFNRALGVNDPRDFLPPAGGQQAESPPSPEPGLRTAGTGRTHQPAIDSAQPPVSGMRTVTPLTAMLLSLTTILLGMILFLTPYQLRWGLLAPRLPAERPVTTLLLGAVALLLFGWFSRVIVRQVACRIIAGRSAGAATGFDRGARGPCAGPLTARRYRLVLWVSLACLAVLPAIAGFLTGNWLLTISSIWMLALSSSDIVTLWAMRDVPGEMVIGPLDHRPGCEILDSSQIDH